MPVPPRDKHVIVFEKEKRKSDHYLAAMHAIVLLLIVLFPSDHSSDKSIDSHCTVKNYWENIELI